MARDLLSNKIFIWTIEFKLYKETKKKKLRTLQIKDFLGASKI